MSKSCKIAAVLGMGLMLASCAVYAQAPAAQPADAQASAAATPAAIPPDQQATKEQLAKLFEVMRIHKQMEDLMKMIPAMAQQQMHAQMNQMRGKLGLGMLSPEKQAEIDKITEKYMNEAINIINIDEMLDDMTTVYQHHLSRSDVDAFIAFYQSPAGQDLLDAQPAIMKEYMPMVMKRVQARSLALTDGMEKDIKDCVASEVPPANKSVAK